MTQGVKVSVTRPDVLKFNPGNADDKGENQPQKFSATSTPTNKYFLERQGNQGSLYRSTLARAVLGEHWAEPDFIHINQQ